MRITTAQLKAQRAGEPLPRPEREVQAAVLAYLRTVPGVVAWRQNTAAVKEGERFIRFGFRGLSDIGGWRSHDVWGPSCYCEATGLINHRHRVSQATPLYIEVKAPGKSPTREQAAFLQAVKDAGGIAIVATSVEDVRKVLQP